MKKTNKKVALILALAMMVVATMVGCGSTDEEASVSNSITFGPSFTPAEASSAYAIEDVTGSWVGTTSLVTVSGAAEMQEYLEELYGRDLTDAEISGLSTATATKDYAEVEIYDYYDEETGGTYPGSWQISMDMGGFFGEQIWDDWDAITYDEFSGNERDAGCIRLDGNNYFRSDVTETDYIGEYGAQFFDVSDSDVADDGKYGFIFEGQVVDANKIEGKISVMFQYGDMSEPYIMVFEYTLDEYYSY